MKRLFVALAAVTAPVIVALSVTTVSAQEGPDMDEALQQLVDQQVQEQGILGMALVAQLADGTVVQATSGFSDPSEQMPYSVDTQTLVGSITKTFAATVVMQLVEEGNLTLDDTIDLWFPEQPNADKITVRMLLSHNSGISDYLGSPNVGARLSEAWAPLDLIAEANLLVTTGEPGGAEGAYSNTNYILLALITESVTGNNWSHDVETRIIEPLGLTNTKVLSVIDETVFSTVVGGYTITGDGYQNLLGMLHPSVGWSAGSVSSTPADLIVFATAFFRGDLFASNETINQVLQPVTQLTVGGFPLDWGLGAAHVDVEGASIWMHPGDVPGYHSFMGFDPEGGAVVVGTINTEEGDVLFAGIGTLQLMAGLAGQ